MKMTEMIPLLVAAIVGFIFGSMMWLWFFAFVSWEGDGEERNRRKGRMGDDRSKTRRPLSAGFYRLPSQRRART
jgi:hypothetical protein